MKDLVAGERLGRKFTCGPFIPHGRGLKLNSPGTIGQKLKLSRVCIIQSAIWHIIELMYGASKLPLYRYKLERQYVQFKSVMTCLYYLMLCNLLLKEVIQEKDMMETGSLFSRLTEGWCSGRSAYNFMVTDCCCHWNWVCWNRIQVVNDAKHHGEDCSSPISNQINQIKSGHLM